MGPLTAASHNAYRLRSRQVWMLVRAAEGWGNDRIGRACGLTEGTVKQELSAVYRTLGVPDRTAAVVALWLAARRMAALERQGECEAA